MAFNRNHTHAAKKTPSEIMEIRRLYAEEGWTQGRLSRYAQLSVGQIGRIVRGESWQQYTQPVHKQQIEHEEALAVLPDDEVTKASLAKLDALLKPLPVMPELQPSADLAARAAAYGVRRPEVGEISKPTTPWRGSIENVDEQAKDREPQPIAVTGIGSYNAEVTGVQPPTVGQIAAGLPGGTTEIREESYENVNQSSGEECDKGNGGEELVAGSATALHEDPHS